MIVQSLRTPFAWKSLKSLGFALSALLLAGSLGGCGEDDASIFLRPLDPDVKRQTIPVDTTMQIRVRLSAVVGTDTFVDIDNPYMQFVTTNPADSIRFQPKDDPPEKIVEVKAVKANTDGLEIKFTLRGTSSVRTIQIIPEAI
ncbi:MAG: hypothetical protein KAI47_04205 [Deltaproteobacteria bacterium]|nr:hypothetical protein [Deltaproteobacteria bacterium]